MKTTLAVFPVILAFLFSFAPILRVCKNIAGHTSKPEYTVKKIE